MGHDPYTPPKSTVADVAPARGGRPGWVWLITLLFGLSALWTLLSLALVALNAIPLDSATRAYYASLSVLDWVLTVAVSLLNLVGIAFLFLLRARALHFLLAALGIGILNTLYQIAAKNLLSVLARPGAFGMVIGLFLWGAIIWYGYRLKKNGVLR